MSFLKANIFQIIGAVAIAVLFFWLGTKVSGCNSTPKAKDAIVITDTVKKTDTAFVAYPIKVRSTPLHDTAFITIHGKEQPIPLNDSIVTITVPEWHDTTVLHRTDTVVKYEKMSFNFDTPFGYSVKAKIGSGFGMYFGIGLDGEIHYKDFGISVQPSLYYIKELRGFCFIGLNYKLF